MLIAKRLPHGFSLDGFQHPIEYVYYTCNAQSSTTLVTVFYPAKALLEEYQSAMPDIASWIVRNRGLDPARSRFVLCERPVDGKGRPQAARLPFTVVDIEWNGDTGVGAQFREVSEADYFDLATSYQCDALWKRRRTTLGKVTLIDVYPVVLQLLKGQGVDDAHSPWQSIRQWDRCIFAYWVDWILVFCVQLEYLRQENVRIEVEWLEDATAFAETLGQSVEAEFGVTFDPVPGLSKFAIGPVRALVRETLERGGSAGSASVTKPEYQVHVEAAECLGSVDDLLEAISHFAGQEAHELGFEPYWPTGASKRRQSTEGQGETLHRRAEVYGMRSEAGSTEGLAWAELVLDKTRADTTRLTLLADESDWESIEPTWLKLLREMEEMHRIVKRQVVDPLQEIKNPKHHEMIQLYNAGYTAQEVGDKLGMRKRAVEKTIGELRKKLGAERIPYRAKPTEKDRG